MTSPPTASAGLLDTYDTSGFYCEMVDGAARDPQIAGVLARLRDVAPEDLRRRAEIAEAELYNLGITFTVYSDRDAIDRILPFDLIPRILTAAEWDHIDRGVRQRVAALNAFLWDIYHDKAILRDGIVPEALVLGNSNYRPEMVGLDVPHHTYVHVCGIDLVRDEKGGFLVLEDNARTPSGVSYVVENRHMMARMFPDLFDGIAVRPVGDYGMRLHTALSEIAPSGDADPRVVLLSPGIYNSAYFEHIFLAREMGVPLVEGRDLIVEDGRVWMRTTAGLAPVHAIYRRLNDDFLDPDVFNPDSVLGVRGLIDVWRRGRVAIANAVGTGVADDKAIYAYMPRIIRYYLSEDAILSNVQTNICAEPEGLAYTLDHLHELVVKPVGESGGYGIIIGPRATAEERAEFREKLVADPGNFISQPMVNLSVSPTLMGSRLAPRHVDLRPFAVTGKDTWVLPGGLTRVALREGSLVVNSSQGGGSKDTWVLEWSEFSAGQSQMQSQQQSSGVSVDETLERRRNAPILLSRSAECLFWLARYMERIENLARILEVTDTFVRHGADQSGWLSVVQINADEKRFLEKHKTATADTVLRFYLADRENPSSLAACLFAARENARTLRPMISTEMWTQINVFYNRARELMADESRRPDVSQICDFLKEGCQFHTGITEGTFFRDEGWAFYSIGKYLERGDQTSRLVDIKYHTLLPSVRDVGGAQDVNQWHALLRAAAGYQAFRRVYPSGMTPAAVAGFLLLNHSFPRSIVQSVHQIETYLTQLGSGYGLRGASKVLEQLDELRAPVMDQSIEQILGRGLHEFLDWVQVQYISIAASMADLFWKKKDDGVKEAGGKQDAA